jgi:hypothetical protein
MLIISSACIDVVVPVHVVEVARRARVVQRGHQRSKHVYIYRIVLSGSIFFQVLSTSKL